jgi:LysR family transcriptional regulator, transcriptional activator for bauABCD operon
VGICFLPEAFAAPDVEAGRLWPLLRHAEQPCMPVFVITNPRAPNKLARQLLLNEIGLLDACELKRQIPLSARTI